MGGRFDFDIVFNLLFWVAVLVPVLTLILGMRAVLGSRNDRVARFGAFAVLLIVVCEICAEILLFFGIAGLMISAMLVALWAAVGLTALVQERFGGIAAAVTGVLTIPTLAAIAAYQVFGMQGVWTVAILTVAVSSFYTLVIVMANHGEPREASAHRPEPTDGALPSDEMPLR